MNAKIFIAIIFGLASVTVNAGWIQTVCTQTGANFQLLYPSKQMIAWNMVEAFESSTHTLGSGSFGLVKKVNTGISGVGEVAIKRSKIKDAMAADLAGAELNVMNTINYATPQVGPRLFGCQYTIEYDFVLRQNVISNVYTVQELMSKELKDFVGTLLTWDRKKVLTLQIGIVKRLAKLWNLGFQHADLKLENVMMNIAQTEALLIDFNLSQPNNVHRSLRGTNKYMAPAVLRKEGFVRPKDDLYSWALMFAAVYTANTIDGLWANLPEQCYTIRTEADCLETLSSNVKYVMSTSGWGEYQTDTRLHGIDFINITTLLANLVAYEKFDNSFETIVTILERNLAEIENPELIKQLPPIGQEQPVTFTAQEQPITYATQENPATYQANAPQNKIVTYTYAQPQPNPQPQAKVNKIIITGAPAQQHQPAKIIIYGKPNPQKYQVAQNYQPLTQEMIQNGYRLVTNYQRGHGIIRI